MGLQSPSWQVEIKARIRKRDGYHCLACCMDQATHKKRYGRILEVHRIVPRSDYSLKRGQCVTLCIVCHDALEHKGTWGWIARYSTHDEDKLARSVKLSAEHDEKEEYAWGCREEWGSRLREFRQRWGRGSRGSLPKLARATGILEKTLRDWEAGRYWPLLPEAARLAKALGIALDDLWREDDPGDWCLQAARERSDARAHCFSGSGTPGGGKPGTRDYVDPGGCGTAQAKVGARANTDLADDHAQRHNRSAFVDDPNKYFGLL